MDRPSASEVAPYYHGYLDLVPDGDVVELLRRQGVLTAEALATLSEARSEQRYAPQKWSIRELVGHLADSERVFAFRALAFARRDPGALPGMDQDQWIAGAGFHARTLRSILAELNAARASSVALFDGLGPETHRRTGEASGCTFTVRTFPWLIAGHERHHLAVLRERYGVDVPLATA